MKIDNQFIAQFLSDAPVIMKAGAHKGFDTIKMAQFWPKSKIYCFEPIPELFNILQENCKPYANIKCFNAALSDFDDEQKIYVSSGKNDASSSLLKPLKYLQENPLVKFDQEIIIKTITLDSWVKQNSIEKIDFLWLDMQGYEMRMLQAAKKSINLIKVLLTEVNLTERYEHCPEYKVFRTWLEDNNFKFVKEHLFKGTWGDALFVRK